MVEPVYLFDLVEKQRSWLSARQSAGRAERRQRQHARLSSAVDVAPFAKVLDQQRIGSSPAPMDCIFRPPPSIRARPRRKEGDELGDEPVGQFGQSRAGDDEGRRNSRRLLARHQHYEVLPRNVDGDVEGMTRKMDALEASMKIAGAGLEAQSSRLRVVAENMANARSTGPTAGANPYVRKTITFANELDRATGRGARSGRSRRRRSLAVSRRARSGQSGRRREGQCQISRTSTC